MAKHAIAPVALAASLVAGCSGGDSYSRAELVDALVDQMTSERTISWQWAQCVAELTVDELGVDHFEENGLTPALIRDGVEPDISDDELAAILPRRDDECGNPLR